MSAEHAVAHAPEQVEELLVRFIHEGELDAAVALFEPGAVLVTPSEQAISDPDGIRRVVSAFIEMQPRITTNVTKTYTAGEIALIHSDWKLEATDESGNPYSRSGVSAIVTRRQAGGEWKVVILNRPGG